MDLKTTSLKNLTNKQKEGLDLFVKKNSDYGDAFATFGVIGIVVRIQDKLARLVNIMKSDNKSTKTAESIEDTNIDLFNYSTMALMLLYERPENLDIENHEMMMMTRKMQMKYVHTLTSEAFLNNFEMYEQLKENNAYNEYSEISKNLLEQFQLEGFNVKIYSITEIEKLLFRIHIYVGIQNLSGNL